MSGALAGLRVVNTRAVHQAGDLDALLRQRGSVPVAYPCIAIVPPADATALDTVLTSLAEGAFDWLVLTSANTVHALAMRLAERGMALASDIPTRVAAVGPVTAAATARQLGLQAALVPSFHTGSELAREIPIADGDTVLLPSSAIARSEVADGLRQRGAVVTDVIAYRNVIGAGGEDVDRLLRERQVDALTFCSSSAVDGFVSRFQAERGSLVDAFALPSICIGQNTLTTARDRGFTSAISAETQTLDGLITALESVFSVQPQGGHRWQ